MSDQGICYDRLPDGPDEWFECALGAGHEGQHEDWIDVGKSVRWGSVS